MEQVDFILSLITEAFAAKNKQVKIVRREVRLSMALKNTLEAFQTEEGEPYYVIGGTDTYFLAGRTILMVRRLSRKPMTSS